MLFTTTSESISIVQVFFCLPSNRDIRLLISVFGLVMSQGVPQRHDARPKSCRRGSPVCRRFDTTEALAAADLSADRDSHITFEDIARFTINCPHCNNTRRVAGKKLYQLLYLT